MKTIFAKTNPAFKRAQLLPMMLDLLPPTAGRAARRFSEFTSPPTALRLPMTGIAVCSSSVSQGAGLPAVRSLN